MPQRLDIQPLQIQPLDIQPLDIQPIEQEQSNLPSYDDPPEKSWLQKWDESVINKPLSHLITGGPVGPRISESLDQPSLERSPLRAQLEGFGAGALEGAANVLEGFTTPLNLATGGAFGIGAKTTGNLARIATQTGKALSAPVVASGAGRIQRGLQGGEDREGSTDWADVGFGVAEAAGGISGLKAKLPEVAKPQPTTRPPVSEGNINFSTKAEMDAAQPAPTAQPDPHIVVLKQPTPARVQDLRNRGYVSGGVNDQGFPQMVRGDIYKKMNVAEEPATPPSDPRTADVNQSIFGDNEISFNEEIRIENPGLGAIKRLKNSGYELVDIEGTIAIFKPISEQESYRPGPGAELPNEFAPDYQHQEYTGFDRRTENQGPGAGLPERRAQDEQFLRPSDKLIPDARQDQLLDILGGKQGLEKFSERNRLQNISKAGELPEGIQLTEDWMPQEMRVPGVKEGKGGLENVAMGGATPRVLDVLGSSLYGRPGPVTTIKELLQNAFDEHRELGQKEPVRVLIAHGQKSPRTGQKAESVTVRDRGRGLTPEQIYTVLTNMGETGKADVESASGGFGFAKAAPFLGGVYTKMTSIVDTPKGRMKYVFEGTPTELKNQAKGVPLHGTKVTDNTPTGLEVSTWYKEDHPGFWQVDSWAQNMTKMSGDLPSPVRIAKAYGSTDEASMRGFLDEVADSKKNDPYNYTRDQAEQFEAEPMPSLQDTAKAPGADIDMRYDVIPNTEEAGYELHMLNKGMYQGTSKGSYGDVTPNVPRSIVADIRATVEEGHPDYPFSANREQLNDSVTATIDKWMRDNVISGVTKKRIAAVQKKYDSIQEIGTNLTKKQATQLPGMKGFAGLGTLTGRLKQVQGEPLHNMHMYDEGNRFTPDEIEYLRDHPEYNNLLSNIEQIHNEILGIADTLNFGPQDYSAKWSIPSQRLKKFGVLYQGADKNGGITEGIHIPRPDDMENSAILINVMEHLNKAISKGDMPIDTLVTDLVTTVTHEIAHIPGGGHDKGHSYRDADLHGKLGEANTIKWLQQIREAVDDGRGGISPQISEVLSIYNDSRGRTASAEDALLKTGIRSQRPPNNTGGKAGNAGGASAGENQPSAVREAYNLSRGMLSSWDASAPLRQGLPLVFSKEWRDALGPMIKSIGEKGAYQAVIDDINAKPIFQRRVNTKTGKIMPSIAQELGLNLTDLGKSLKGREENIASNWAEKVPGVKQSNRGYTAFLNKLRAETFEKLMNEARDMAIKAAGGEEIANPGISGLFGAKKSYTPDEAMMLNPYRNKMLGKQIADYVMTATGRGPLKIDTPSFQGGLHMKERSFEQAGKYLTAALFSPRLFTSRIRMLNPGTYVMANPYVRKQYVKALLSSAGAWGTVASLAWGAGADVSLDPDSSDFGKIKIGNTRLDPAGGFQQYLVAAHRLLSGQTTSSASGQEFELGEGYQAETGKDIGERFLTNKLHPVLKFAYDLWDASEYKPFHMGDRLAQMYIPLIAQDVYELAKEDPALIPLAIPMAFGMGSQTYQAGETQSKIWPESMDMTFESVPTKGPYDFMMGR